MGRMKISYLGLLSALVVFLVLQPFLEPGSWGARLDDLAFSLVLLAGLATAAGHPRQLRWGAALLIPALVARWVAHLSGAEWLAVLRLVLSLLFLVYAAFLVLVDLAREREVSLDTISGGICVYLLLGVGWALGYAVVEVVAPGSFAMGGEALPPPSFALDDGGAWLWSFIYLSFVTLTTLGYGDLTPLTRVTQMLTSAEAIFGQLFIAVFIARLVGLYAARRLSGT
jgi:hypothetical protein